MSLEMWVVLAVALCLFTVIIKSLNRTRTEKEHLHAQFKEIDFYIDKLHKRFERVETRIDRIEGRL